MFLVGHAVVAFLIAYLICRIFKINQGVSFALAMLIGTIPDIDIMTQAIGIMPHKTFTHSLIISAGIGSSIFLVAKVGFKQTAAGAIIYSLAYVQHLLDDVIIGTLNILYPIGNLPVGIGISYGSLPHDIIEILLITVAASIIVTKSFRNKLDITLPFRFLTVDKISYVLLILSFVVSSGYMLYEIESLPRLVVQTNLEMALFILLHLAAIAWILFTMIVARQLFILHRKIISSKS